MCRNRAPRDHDISIGIGFPGFVSSHLIIIGNPSHQKKNLGGGPICENARAAKQRGARSPHPGAALARRPSASETSGLRAPSDPSRTHHGRRSRDGSNGLLDLALRLRNASRVWRVRDGGTAPPRRSLRSPQPCSQRGGSVRGDPCARRGGPAGISDTGHKSEMYLVSETDR